jgi:uncharacterized protein (DUF1330 family)
MPETPGQTRCYMIVYGAFTDFERFLAGYQAAVGPMVERFGGRYVMMGQGLQMLEGAFPEGGGAVISEWPDRAAALKFWTSPEYAEAKKLREGTGTFQVVLIDAPALGRLPLREKEGTGGAARRVKDEGFLGGSH